jgi:hypothetical protein
MSYIQLYIKMHISRVIQDIVVFMIEIAKSKYFIVESTFRTLNTNVLHE